MEEKKPSQHKKNVVKNNCKPELQVKENANWKYDKIEFSAKVPFSKEEIHR